MSARVPYSRAQVNAVYFSYLNRSGPENLGTIEWPAPKPGCLSGMKFLTTGVLDTITREDAIELLRQCGGHVMSGMSKNLDYLIVGREAGPVKLENAAEWGLKQLSEEEFFNFMKDKIDNYDPSQANGVGEKKPTKKSVVKKAVKKVEMKKEELKSPVKKPEPKVEAKTKKSDSKKVIKAEDRKPAKVDKRSKASRVRASIEIDMATEGDSAKVTKKRVKEEAEENGKPTKKSKATIVKNEPVPDSEEPPVVTKTKASKKKVAQKEPVVKTEPVVEKEPVVKKKTVVKKGSTVKKEPVVKEVEASQPKRGRSKK